MTHRRCMQQALVEARKGVGSTWPNPPVGAVVVKQGRVIGRGYHRRAGTPHAEVHALRAAGERTRGADLYVTLEPCGHHGRTPPCTEAILASGIARVFVGSRDPHPLVSGKGVRALRRAGVEVHTSILQHECDHMIAPYLHRLCHGVPLVTCKVALSLDGKIATAAGTSQWITGRACRRYVHELRSAADAILIGAGTVRCDDPMLTVRLHGRTKLKPVIVLDSRLRLSADRQLFHRFGHIILATTTRAPRSRVTWAQARGYQVLICRENHLGRVSLSDLLQKLGKQGMTSLLVEGGGEVYADLFARRLIDRVVACVAPKFLGGEAQEFLPGVRVKKLALAPALTSIAVRQLGNDVVLEGNLK